MNQKLIKLLTEDSIELAGILYESETRTKKIVVHVHGLAGNFYENGFVDYQAESYTSNGYSYLAFNNRGNGYLTELIKRGEDKLAYINGGAAFEIFEESYYDIDSAIQYVLSLGYEDIVLQGHSYGCNKVIYYYFKNKVKNISSIILLAPCDIVEEFKMFIGDEYNDYIKKCEKALSENILGKIIENKLFPPMGFSAKTFMNNFINDCKGDIFRYRDIKHIARDLNDIRIPILVQIGNKDNNVLVVDKNDVTSYLKNNISNLELKYIKDSNHGYYNHENEMCDNCIRFLNGKNK